MLRPFQPKENIAKVGNVFFFNSLSSVNECSQFSTNCSQNQATNCCSTLLLSAAVIIRCQAATFWPINKKPQPSTKNQNIANIGKVYRPVYCSDRKHNVSMICCGCICISWFSSEAEKIARTGVNQWTPSKLLLENTLPKINVSCVFFKRVENTSVLCGLTIRPIWGLFVRPDKKLAHISRAK